jgi:hypothetical protein
MAGRNSLYTLIVSIGWQVLAELVFFIALIAVTVQRKRE